MHERSRSRVMTTPPSPPETPIVLVLVLVLSISSPSPDNAGLHFHSPSPRKHSAESHSYTTKRPPRRPGHIGLHQKHARVRRRARSMARANAQRRRKNSVSSAAASSSSPRRRRLDDTKPSISPSPRNKPSNYIGPPESVSPAKARYMCRAKRAAKPRSPRDAQRGSRPNKPNGLTKIEETELYREPKSDRKSASELRLGHDLSPLGA